MTPELSAQEIRSLLRRLGVTENYAGFSCTVCAVQLSLEDPARLRLITKRIYPDVPAAAPQPASGWNATSARFRARPGTKTARCSWSWRDSPWPAGPTTPASWRFSWGPVWTAAERTAFSIKEIEWACRGWVREFEETVGKIEQEGG